MLRQLEFIILTTACLILPGCGSCKRDSGGQDITATPVTLTPTITPVSETSQSTRSNLDISSFRLSPEQIANHLEHALSSKMGWTDSRGVFHHLISETLAVPLGGVDFKSAAVRDPTPKIDTLLLVRRLAWLIAAEVVYRESNTDNPEQRRVIVFTAIDIYADRPYIEELDQNLGDEHIATIREGEKRWENQLDLLYLRLFARQPNAEEVAAIKDTFSKVYLSGSWAPKSWTVVLYSLLSTAEFWNI